MSYEELENYLSEQLQGNFFDCAPLPDNETEYKQGLSRPKVYVSYDASDYSDSENLGMTIQEDRIRFGFTIEALKRRGETGILATFEVIKSKILGLKIQGFDKMQLLTFTPLEGIRPNSWRYYAQFTTLGHVSENQPDPDEDGNVLKDPEFLKP